MPATQQRSRLSSGSWLAAGQAVPYPLHHTPSAQVWAQLASAINLLRGLSNRTQKSPERGEPGTMNNVGEMKKLREKEITDKFSSLHSSLYSGKGQKLFQTKITTFHFTSVNQLHSPTQDK